MATVEGKGWGRSGELWSVLRAKVGVGGVKCGKRVKPNHQKS